MDGPDGTGPPPGQDEKPTPGHVPRISVESIEEQMEKLHGKFGRRAVSSSRGINLKPLTDVVDRTWEKLVRDTGGGVSSDSDEAADEDHHIITSTDSHLECDTSPNHVCNSLFGACAARGAAATGSSGNHPPHSTHLPSGQTMGNGPPGRIAPQVAVLRKQLRQKDIEIANLKRELHKIKSVLQATTTLNNDEALCWLQQSNNVPPTGLGPCKKQGVSAESPQNDQLGVGSIHLQRHEKDFRAKQLIKGALLENDFLKNLEPGQAREIVECMYSRQCAVGSYLIREGEAGSHLFVSAAGSFEVIKDGTVLGTMGPGKAFGELAILYNCTRTASVRVVQDGEVWVLDRKVFQSIMLKSGLQRLEDSLSFLRSVPLLHNLNEGLLAKIADSLQLEFYPGGHYIVRQGASGDTFYILSAGKVKVTRRISGTSEEEPVRTLTRGDYFGEQALLKEDSRTANVIALPPGVECLTLDRESFMLLIGDLSELQEKDYGDRTRLSRPPSSHSFHESDLGEDVDLKDLDVVATLGVGGFGRVELVTTSSGSVYALKCMKKCHIVETHQQSHVYSERDIMLNCRSPFICRLYKTFKDTKYVYLLMEACLGGEVWTLLRDRTCFDDTTACFITACVIEALDYLHSRNIVYRDLKPENLLLDATGYVKLVDFGFAKKFSSSSSKTWTFCGTPEYVAPEIILNRGHDTSVDYWALGILIYELLTGAPPFSGSDPMKTYTLILKGIESVSFPRHVTRTAQTLVKRLCREVPSDRLGSHHAGISDIKKHKWFQGFDWDGLSSRTMTPPIIPKLCGPTDSSNFDKYPQDDKTPPDELSNWDIEF